MKNYLLPGIAAVLLGASGLAMAQGTAVPLKSDEIIATRQAGFDLQGGVASAMKAAIEGGLDVKPLTAGAKGIAAWGRVIPIMFPDGTQKGHDTKAKSEIWSDRAGFEKDGAALVAAADKLAQLADANDKAGFAAQYTITTQACGACHRAYREK